MPGHATPAPAALRPPQNFHTIPRRVLLRHGLLFAVTVFTTTLAGAEWATHRSWLPDEVQVQHGIPALGWADLHLGLPYALALLLFLTVHEFGHYLTARYHRVPSTLPWYIPLPPFLGLNIGTMGAIIRIQRQPASRRQFFDIGVAGPLAGFVVAVGVLALGLLALPLPSELPVYGGPLLHADTHLVLRTGPSLLYDGMAALLADPARMPGHHTMMNYPLLLAGYLGLFFTALNMLPIGQLDGGHVVYGLLGPRRALIISRLTVGLMVLYGGTGIFGPELMEELGTAWFGVAVAAYALALLWLAYRVLHTRRVAVLAASAAGIIAAQQLLHWLLPDLAAYPGWLVLALLAGGILGVRHPVTYDERPLTLRQKALGILALVILVVCISPAPLSMDEVWSLGGLR